MISLVFDVETTGLPVHPNARMDVQPRIIEFGGVLVDSSGEILQEIEFLINPEVIPTDGSGNLLDAAGIMKISGIDVKDLEDKPIFTDIAPQIRPFFEKADQLISHNLPFDHMLMELDLKRAEIEDWPWPGIFTCTAQEHQEWWGNGRRPKLLQLYEYYTGNPLEQTHRALDDVKALVEVCIHSEVL